MATDRLSAEFVPQRPSSGARPVVSYSWRATIPTGWFFFTGPMDPWLRFLAMTGSVISRRRGARTAVLA
jgi:hypothetical protein